MHKGHTILFSDTMQKNGRADHGQIKYLRPNRADRCTVKVNNNIELTIRELKKQVDLYGILRRLRDRALFATTKDRCRAKRLKAKYHVERKSRNNGNGKGKEQRGRT